MIDKDAFSQGQVESKLWLCEQLERINWNHNPTIWILGGWQGVLSFLLFSRNQLNIKQIRSYDVDPTCEPVADMINNTWVVDNWRFKAHTEDCTYLDYSSNPDIVINTSTEHFQNNKWFDNIPSGTLVCIQGNDLNHEDHFSHYKNFEQFKNSFKFQNIMYEGEKNFSYPDFKFTRYMIIGIK
jgi:hypothetical protein